MLDIIEAIEGEDLTVADSIVAKAGNVLSIQLGALEYAQEFGVDFRYFLNSEFQFQNSSFQAYLVQRLTESQVNVSQVMTVLETLYAKYTYYVGDVQTTGGLIL
jgi:hypothetical protein